MVNNVELIRAEGEKLRADIREISEQSAFNRKAEVWKIIIQASIGAAALLGAGVAVGRFVVLRQ